MKLHLVALAAVTMAASNPASAQQASPPPGPGVGNVAPGLNHYTEQVVESDLWRRPDLSPRDRSVVTVSALIAAGQTAALTAELNRALDHGVTPSEISAILTHLAFYAGWPQALSAVAVAKPIFAARGIAADQLAAASSERLPIDEVADRQRAAGVENAYGAVSPSIVRYTNEVLFNDLWRRPDLTPRDRSLVTISALIAGGHAEQLPFHLRRGMQNGVTRPQIAETITQLAFYAGWPKALSAVPAARNAFEER
jgi:4-carboxymuconolactone decarboxylase